MYVFEVKELKGGGFGSEEIFSELEVVRVISCGMDINIIKNFLRYFIGIYFLCFKYCLYLKYDFFNIFIFKIIFY